MFTAALFIIVKAWKQPKRPSTDTWIKKMWSTYTMQYYSAATKNETGRVQQHGCKQRCTMQYYSAATKNETRPCAATWMQTEVTILSEVSQEEKDKHHVLSLTCGL